MPELDGRQTIARIRSDPRLSESALVVVTPSSSDISALPIAAVLRKPFSMDKLLRTLWPLVRGPRSAFGV